MTHCFCVLGWHFQAEFYEQLWPLPGDKYIISHRAPEFFDARDPLFIRLQPRLYFCANQGLEWGGYHQFNAMGRYLDYDFVVYMHDDVIIKDASLVSAVREKFQNEPGVQVIGNGRNGSDWEFRFGKYRERMPYDEADDFIVRTVRGSFFAARSTIFEKLGNFPVHWRAKKMTHGNLSLRNFGYLVSKHFGRESIAYLEAESWLETKYLVELQRGEPATIREDTFV